MDLILQVIRYLWFTGQQW